MHDEVEEKDAEAFVEGEREKAEIRKLRVGGLLAPWLAEALDKIKMISVRDLRITNFSLFG